MRGLADKAWRRGWSAVLLNQRNCGGTEYLTPGLYHSGLTGGPARGDPRTGRGRPAHSSRDRRLLARRQSCREIGRRAWRPPGPSRPRGDGGQPDDRSRAMRSRDRAARPTIPISGTSCATFATGCDARPVPGRARSTSRRSVASGRFGGSTTSTRRRTMASRAPRDYYREASALRVADRIRLPVLILTAADDPFVPA